MADLAVALDVPGRTEALELARELRGVTGWVKVGLELFVIAGPELLRDLQRMDFSLFLDLKFLDIPRTVEAAARQAAALGVGLMTLHVTGGERMCRAAVEGRNQGGRAARLIGVTVLTSMDARDLPEGREPSELALELARRGRDWGLDGVVCSGLEAARIRQSTGAEFFVVTPGIRPASARADDQRRVASPAEAVAAGSDLLVVGRPITGASSPREAARAIMAEMRGV